MNEIVIAAADIGLVRDYLLSRDVEGCAILYASETRRRDGSIRLLIRDIETPVANDYTSAGYEHAELRPTFVAAITKRAKLSGLTLVFVHSHPGNERPKFSAIDDEGERRLGAFLAHRLPGKANAALVLSKGGVRARTLGTGVEVAVISLGEYREVMFDPNELTEPLVEMYDRQIRAFGKTGQSVLEKLSVGIVGLGGTGSIIAQELVHLGVNSFTLIDPDIIERTNLNRVVGASPDSISRRKVDVAADYIRGFSSHATIKVMQGDVVLASVAEELKEVHCIFGCTDSHGSRAVLQQVAYQYLIPLFDVGAVIATSGRDVTHISGRAQMLSPGLACFACDDFLDPEQVRRDLMSAFERQADPYIIGTHEPAPAVISLNSTVSSLAITMFLSAFTGISIAGRHLLYDAKRSLIRKIRNPPVADCYICSKQGTFARGDAWPLFARAE